MAEIVGKVFDSVNDIVLSGSTSIGRPEGGDIPIPLQVFFLKLMATKSKKDVDFAISKQLDAIYCILSRPGVKPVVQKNCLIFVMICEVGYGYKVPYAPIFAVKLVEQGSYREKRVGYLACSLLLGIESELQILLVNSLIRDVSSLNPLEIAVGLSAMICLLPDDMITGVLPLVISRLTHSSAFVRRKATNTLHVLLKKTIDSDIWSVRMICDHTRYLLQDKDLGVVWLALQLIESSVKQYNAEDLLAVLAHIQLQILELKIPEDYFFHKVPAPWMQMTIFRILRSIPEAKGRRDVWDLLTKTFITLNNISELIAVAVLQECVTSMLYVGEANCESEAVLKFTMDMLNCENSNLIDVGLDVVGYLCSNDSTIQMNLIHSIKKANNHVDPHIQQKAIDLIISLAGTENAEDIAEKIFKSIERCTDSQQLRKWCSILVRLVNKNEHCNLEWQLSVLFRALPYADRIAIMELSQKIKAILTNNKLDTKIKMTLLNLVCQICKGKNVRGSVIELCLWIFTKYSSDKQHVPVLLYITNEYLLKEKCSTALQLSIIGALECAFTFIDEKQFSDILDLFLKVSESTESVLIRERISISVQLLKTKLEIEYVHMPYDYTLSFLDEFVVYSLKHGCNPPKPPVQFDTKEKKSSSKVSEDTSLVIAETSSTELKDSTEDVIFNQQQLDTAEDLQPEEICTRKPLDVLLSSNDFFSSFARKELSG